MHTGGRAMNETINKIGYYTQSLKQQNELQQDYYYCQKNTL